MPGRYNQRTRVVFDGHVLTDYFLVGNPELPMPSPTASMRDVAGMDGAVPDGQRLQQVELAVTVSAWEDSRSDRRALMSMLWQWLRVDEPKPLQIGDEPYWLAIPSGGGDMEHFANADAVEVRFVAADPVRYGATRSAAIPSGGSVSIHVGGNYPTRPRITAAAAVRASNGLWGIRLDDGDYSNVAIPTSSASAVVIDASTREVRIAGAPAMITLASDWLELEPGEHTLAMTQGTGAAVIEWTERWL